MWVGVVWCALVWSGVGGGGALGGLRGGLWGVKGLVAKERGYDLKNQQAKETHPHTHE